MAKLMINATSRMVMHGALDTARLITGETPYITSSTDGAARRQIAKSEVSDACRDCF